MSDLAAKVSLLSGGGELYPTDYAIGSKFRAASGKFVSNAIAQEILGWPKFEGLTELDFKRKTGAKGFLIDGEIVVFGADKFVALLNRKAFAQEKLKSIKPVVDKAIAQLLNTLKEQLVAEAVSIVDTMVYNTPAEVIRGTLKYITAEQEFGLKEWQRGWLREAVRGGIVIDGNSIVIGIDEKLAPYWFFVEHGHRVVLPGGIVTNSFVLGRPFFRAIKMSAEEMLNSAIQSIASEFDIIAQHLITYIENPQSAGFTPVTTEGLF